MSTWWADHSDVKQAQAQAVSGELYGPRSDTANINSKPTLRDIRRHTGKLQQKHAHHHYHHHHERHAFNPLEVSTWWDNESYSSSGEESDDPDEGDNSQAAKLRRRREQSVEKMTAVERFQGRAEGVDKLASAALASAAKKKKANKAKKAKKTKKSGETKKVPQPIIEDSLGVFDGEAGDGQTDQASYVPTTQEVDDTRLGWGEVKVPAKEPAIESKPTFVSEKWVRSPDTGEWIPNPAYRRRLSD